MVGLLIVVVVIVTPDAVAVDNDVLMYAESKMEKGSNEEEGW